MNLKKIKNYILIVIVTFIVYKLVYSLHTYFRVKKGVNDGKKSTFFEIRNGKTIINEDVISHQRGRERKFCISFDELNKSFQMILSSSINSCAKKIAEKMKDEKEGEVKDKREDKKDSFTGAMENHISQVAGRHITMKETYEKVSKIEETNKEEEKKEYFISKDTCTIILHGKRSTYYYHYIWDHLKKYRTENIYYYTNLENYENSLVHVPLKNIIFQPHYDKNYIKKCLWYPRLFRWWMKDSQLLINNLWVNLGRHYILKKMCKKFLILEDDFKATDWDIISETCKRNSENPRIINLFDSKSYPDRRNKLCSPSELAEIKKDYTPKERFMGWGMVAVFFPEKTFYPFLNYVNKMKCSNPVDELLSRYTPYAVKYHCNIIKHMGVESTIGSHFHD